MKYIFLFCSFFLAFQIVKAQSAMIDNEQNIIIDKRFTTQQLTTQRLKGFEFRAEQKLTEFAQLIALASNITYKPEMRQHAAQLGIALFENKEANIFILNQKKTLTVKKFFDGLIIAKTPTNFEFTDFMTINPLSPQKDTYLGTISFNISHNNKKTAYQADIILLKVPKSFGKTTEYVWEVRIKSIYRRP